MTEEQNVKQWDVINAQKLADQKIISFFAGEMEDVCHHCGAIFCPKELYKKSCSHGGKIKLS